MTSRPWLTTELKVVEYYRSCGRSGREGWQKPCAEALSRSVPSIKNAAIGLPKQAIRTKSHLKKWSQEDESDLMVMYKARLSWKSIAMVMDRTVPACRGRYQQIKQRAQDAEDKAAT